ncbi:MAG: hypothetical protein DI582_03975 [Azospirillum brasilense]|nr:MAG: hypothetical protein DI582_03975 [Azospirillum brasilense]
MNQPFDFRRLLKTASPAEPPVPSNDVHAQPRHAVCDESEGMSVEEQRAWDKANPGQQSAPYPPGQHQQWVDLLRSNRWDNARER